LIKIWATEPALESHQDDDLEISQLPVQHTTSGSSELSGTVSRVSWDLHGHSSRIWYLCANNAGDQLYSASGDGTIKIWSIKNALSNFGDETSSSTHSDCITTLTGHKGDVYTVS